MLLESLVKATLELQGFRVVLVTGNAGGLVAELACGWRISKNRLHRSIFMPREPESSATFSR